jgi:hypothetical protein
MRSVIVKRRCFSCDVRVRFSGERRQLACNRRQLADGIFVLGKLPSTAG